MKIFITKVIIFMIPVAVLIVFYLNVAPVVLEKHYGDSTKTQIDKSFDYANQGQYDVLVLGNSRMYRGIDPNEFSYSAYNFAHDNDSYNQNYFKLKHLLSNKKQIKHLILGVDYFEFSFLASSRNYIYGRHFGDEYLNDFKSVDERLKLANDEIYNQYMDNNFRTNLPLVLKGLLTTPPEETNYLAENGQFIKFDEQTSENDSIVRDYNKLEIQEEYFHKTLALAKEYGIKVYLVMPPAREGELQSYPEDVMQKYDDYFNNEVDNEHVLGYLNYARDYRFTMDDFSDITHLNIEGAKKFTGILNDEIQFD